MTKIFCSVLIILLSSTSYSQEFDLKNTKWKTTLITDTVIWSTIKENYSDKTIQFKEKDTLLIQGKNIAPEYGYYNLIKGQPNIVQLEFTTFNTHESDTILVVNHDTHIIEIVNPEKMIWKEPRNFDLGRTIVLERIE